MLGTCYWPWCLGFRGTFVWAEGSCAHSRSISIFCSFTPCAAFLFDTSSTVLEGPCPSAVDFQGQQASVAGGKRSESPVLWAKCGPGHSIQAITLLPSSKACSVQNVEAHFKTWKGTGWTCGLSKFTFVAVHVEDLNAHIGKELLR